MDNAHTNTWQFLDTCTIMMKEFASALGKIENLAAWSPAVETFGAFRHWQRPEVLPDPYLKMLHFPLQRGYARLPMRWIAPFQAGMVKRMTAQTARPELSPLVCSTPFYAPVAELWPGPVIYYMTDLNVAYKSLSPGLVRSLDRRMCRVARAICPNSKRTASYLISEAQCDRGKITIIPNATRESNVPRSPRYEPAELPSDARDLPRPIAGVLGDLSENMDWELLVDTIQRTPRLNWLFVGPTDRTIADRRQRAARAQAMQMARFVGMKPYGELQAYARCLDVAVLPYRKNEPTYSGSSTRFYEHLAAGRPMVATRGFAELLEKEPLLTLVDTADEMAAALEHLRLLNFRDGLEAERWEASKQATWEVRARALRATIQPAHQGEVRDASVAVSSI
jgi:glycosyltransferase involved in cell wall biosynthesis